MGSLLFCFLVLEGLSKLGLRRMPKHTETPIDYVPDGSKILVCLFRSWSGKRIACAVSCVKISQFQEYHE